MEKVEREEIMHNSRDRSPCICARALFYSGWCVAMYVYVCVDAHHVSTTIKVTVLGGCALINYEGDISRGSQSERERERKPA